MMTRGHSVLTNHRADEQQKCSIPVIPSWYDAVYVVPQVCTQSSRVECEPLYNLMDGCPGPGAMAQINIYMPLWTASGGGGGGACGHEMQWLAALYRTQSNTNLLAEADVVPVHNVSSPKSFHVGRYSFLNFLQRDLGFSVGYYAMVFKRKFYMSKPKIITTGSCGAKLYVKRYSPSITDLDRPWRFQDVEAPRYYDTQHMKA
jgi:hypothetical protein